MALRPAGAAAERDGDGKGGRMRYLGKTEKWGYFLGFGFGSALSKAPGPDGAEPEASLTAPGPASLHLLSVASMTWPRISSRPSCSRKMSVICHMRTCSTWKAGLPRSPGSAASVKKFMSRSLLLGSWWL